VFLDVDFRTGAKRIYDDVRSNQDKRNEGRYKTLQDAEKAIKNRLESDIRRYRKYYNMDIHDKSQYDIVIDTTKMTPDEVADEVLRRIGKRALTRLPSSP